MNEINIEDLKEIRRKIPLQIAQELVNVQPLNINLTDIFLSKKQIFKCSCGIILLETSSFNLKEINIECKCSKKWELKPVCETTKLMWTWNEVK